MSHAFSRRWTTLGAALATCALIVPAVVLATTTSATAATAYPDNTSQPVPFGDAGYFGSMAGVQLNAPVVGMAPTPDGKGYWLVASDGGVFSFGDAGSYGSMGGQALHDPVVGMAPTPDGKGYWLVASDGGIFAFGDADFYGSTGNMHLNAPDRGHGRHTRRQAATGSWRRTAGCSPTAMPRSSGRWVVNA